MIKSTCDGAMVIITVDVGYSAGTPAAYRYGAEALLKDTIRHLKDSENFARAVWEFDNLRDVCSYCGLDWETEEDGTPCCCDKAIVEFDSLKLSEVTA